MNILEKYLLDNKQLIIAIIGYQGSKKSEFAKKLSNDFKFKLININDYYKENSFIEENIKDATIKIYEHYDNYNWKELSTKVNKLKSKGVVLYGNIIDVDKTTFTIDYMFFITIKNTQFKEFLIKNNKISLKENYLDLYITNYITPLYENLKKKIKVNKFYNIKDKNDIEKIYQDLFNYLIISIKKKINSY